MPMSNGTYYAPTWNNNAPPAINATELQAISDTTAIVPTLVRPNLLDNWLFVGGGSQQGNGQFPINQRKSTSYTTTGYTVDRWQIGINNGVTVQSDSVLITDSSGSHQNWKIFTQKIPDANKYRGLTLTLSILCGGTVTSGLAKPVIRLESNGSYVDQRKDNTLVANGIATTTWTIPTSGTFDTIVAGTMQDTTGTGSYEIIAMKLEVGDTQTLAHYDDTNSAWVLNEVPDYEEQLFRCQTSYADASDLYANQDNQVGVQFRPNLIDNWYFIGGGSQTLDGQLPINQRGATSYTFNSGTGYGIDRLTINNASLTISSGYISFSSGTPATSYKRAQYRSEVTLRSGTTYTLSIIKKTTATTGSSVFRVCDSTGSSISSKVTGDPQISLNSVNSTFALLSTTFTCNQDITNFRAEILVYNASTHSLSVDVQAWKLEVGTSQTLAHLENGTWVINELPNYDEMLFKCQRYFQTYSELNWTPSSWIDCRPPMRTSFTTTQLNYSGTSFIGCSADL